MSEQDDDRDAVADAGDAAPGADSRGESVGEDETVDSSGGGPDGDSTTTGTSTTTGATAEAEDSEPDASDGHAADQSTGGTDGEHPANGDSGPADERAETDALEDFAEKPTGDVDAALTSIIGDVSDTSPADSGSSRSDAAHLVESDVDDDLVEEIREADATAVAQATQFLRNELARLEAELDAERERADDLESRLKRKQADFQNYKKRQQRKLEREKARATEDLVTRLLDVRDNLQRALDQDAGVDIRDGVESTLGQFDQQLDREGVDAIEPAPGDEVDPQRHEVLATVASEYPADRISHVHRPGYEMAEKVLRPAQVAVSDGSQAGENDGPSDGAEGAEGAEDAEGDDDGEGADGADGSAAGENGDGTDDAEVGNGADGGDDGNDAEGGEDGNGATEGDVGGSRSEDGSDR